MMKHALASLCFLTVTQALAADKPRPALEHTTAVIVEETRAVETQDETAITPTVIGQPDVDGNETPDVELTTPAAPASPPRLFEAVYDARVSVARGRATMRLGRTPDNQFIFTSTSKARGAARLFRRKPITECSRFSLAQNGHWQAERYRYEDGKKNSTIVFDWLSATAKATYRDDSKTLEIKPGSMDRLLEQLIVSRLIVDQATISPLSIIDRAALNTVNYELLGKAQIDVPAGRFETVRYRRNREGSKRSSIIWFAPALDGLPVRIEQYRLDERQAIAELDRYSDEATLQARGTVTPVCP